MLIFIVIGVPLAIGLAYATYLHWFITSTKCRECGGRYHPSWEEPRNEAFWGKEDMSNLCPNCTGGN